MNTLSLTEASYSVANAIPRAYTLEYHTPENKPLISVVWKGFGRYFVRCYTRSETETENDLLTLTRSFNAPTLEEAKHIADKLAVGAFPF